MGSFTRTPSSSFSPAPFPFLCGAQAPYILLRLPEVHHLSKVTQQIQ